MNDVVDFMVLYQSFNSYKGKPWKKGDRIRCQIDDCWWKGTVHKVEKKETPFLWDIIWPKKYKFYTYFRYTLQVPLFFGILNIISLIIAEHFGLTLRNRFVVIGVISWLFMMVRQTINNIYNFKTIGRFIRYYIVMFILYMFIWNIVIYNLEKHM